MTNINDMFLQLADKYARPKTVVPDEKKLVENEVAKSLKGAEVEFGGRLVNTLKRTK